MKVCQDGRSKPQLTPDPLASNHALGYFGEAMSAALPSHFADRLIAAVRAKGNPVLVGLDPRAESLPPGLLVGNSPEDLSFAYCEFCKRVIDVVAPLVPAVKPQAAFFEQLGPAGCFALKAVIDYAAATGLLVILDGKRNDIGSTAQGYAEAYLGAGEASPWGCDALTVSPYLGDDSLTPFVEIAKRAGQAFSSWSRRAIPVASGFRTSLPRAGPSIATSLTSSNSLPRKPRAQAATAWSGRLSARPIRSNWPSCAPRCRTPGC